MTDVAVHVKLDENGDVCAVTNARIGRGWICAPDAVAADPFGHRVCPDRGWVEKTAEECVAFERRHNPAPAEHPADEEIRGLLEKLGEENRPPPTASERLAILLARRVLSQG